MQRVLHPPFEFIFQFAAFLRIDKYDVINGIACSISSEETMSYYRLIPYLAPCQRLETGISENPSNKIKSQNAASAISSIVR